jgi:hypothetical protein
MGDIPKYDQNFEPSLSSKSEVIIVEPKLDLLKTLERYDSGRFYRLKNILQRAGFFANNLGLELVIDLFMPVTMPEAGGYWNLDKTVAVSPMSAFLIPIDLLAYYIIHELMHAGLFTGEQSVIDESLTDFMAKKKAAELTGRNISYFVSGYDELVDTLDKYFRDMSFEDIIDLIQGGSKETLVNLLAAITIEFELINEGGKFKWYEIQSSIKSKWAEVCRLFPRLLQMANLNTDDPKEISLFKDYIDEPETYLLESILEKAAERLVAKPEVIFNIISKLHNIESYNRVGIKEALVRGGYSYIVDFADEELDLIIDQYIFYRNSRINPAFTASYLDIAAA